jgi:hypothetical protein
MTGIRRVSQLGTTGESTYVDGSIQAADIAANVITQDKLSTDIPLSGMRNSLINGGFDVWQRGTGSIAPANGVITNTDRWVHTGNTTTFTQQTDVPAGFRYSLGVSGSDPSFAQKIEAANSTRLASQTVTFSIWAKSISGSTSLFVNFYYPSAVDNFASLTTISSTTIAATVSSSWTRYTLTVALPANVTNGLQVLVGRSSGASNTYFTGVQLEVGPQATPFEQRPIGVELALCQRYFYSSYSNGVAINGADVISGHHQAIGVDTTSAVMSNGTFAVPMRATPTFNIYQPRGSVGSGSIRNHSNGGGDITGMSIIGVGNRGLGYIGKSGAIALGSFYGMEMTADAEL